MVVERSLELAGHEAVDTVLRRETLARDDDMKLSAVNPYAGQPALAPTARRRPALASSTSNGAQFELKPKNGLLEGRAKPPYLIAIPDSISLFWAVSLPKL